MAYVLPTFNLSLDYWFPGDRPSTDPPDTQVQCQLYVYSRAMLFDRVTPITLTAEAVETYIRLSFDELYRIGPTIVGGTFRYADPFGIDWFWNTIAWEFVHLGFPNEYAQARVIQCNADLTVPASFR